VVCQLYVLEGIDTSVKNGDEAAYGSKSKRDWFHGIIV